MKVAAHSKMNMSRPGEHLVSKCKQIPSALKVEIANSSNSASSKSVLDAAKRDREEQENGKQEHAAKKAREETAPMTARMEERRTELERLMNIDVSMSA